jgi:hypothetical protein
LLLALLSERDGVLVYFLSKFSHWLLALLYGIYEWGGQIIHCLQKIINFISKLTYTRHLREVS